MTDRQQQLFDPSPPAWELDDEWDRSVASVVFPVPPYGPLDYSVPEGLRASAEAGRRLRLPMGRANRLVVGYCVSVEQRRSPVRPLKEVKGVIDAEPLLAPAMLRLTQWIAEYYLCPWGQVLEAVIPAGVRGRAGTREMRFYSVPAQVASRLSRLKLPPKQAEALRHLAAATRPLTAQQLSEALGSTTAPVMALVKKGLLESHTRRVHRPPHWDAPLATDADSPRVANTAQHAALGAILDALRSGRHHTILVHGVTASGKTEVYIRAIEEVLGNGRQAIVLVPEISLTPQTRHRFRSRLGDVAVLHSHLSAAQRHWHWQRIARGEVHVVIGARSAIFAPTTKLGLIVLDEEHDSSFKQDSSPRYHARDVALRRAELEQVPLVLGSATPSLESYYRATQGVYRLVVMPERVKSRPLPDVATIDLRTQSRGLQHGAISRQLHQAIHCALDDGGQVILLLNRRGFSTHIQCPACGEVVRCPHCDLALTHHRHGERAVCHYCNFETMAPRVCPACRFDAIRYSGYGTQRLEAEIRARFPHATCLRMDSDSMRKPGSHEVTLERFRSGEAQILLGTQMIAKGLDFPNVTLVGVVNADIALHLPDFRAAERTFQLLTQVAGRCGRGDRGGRVLVQTYSPDHAAIRAAIGHDYKRFVAGELPVRKQHGYPPFSSLIRIIVRGPSERAAEQFAQKCAADLRDQLERDRVVARILGPAPAPMAKLRGKFRFHLQLDSADGHHLRAAVVTVAGKLKSPQEIQWIIDVDALDMM